MQEAQSNYKGLSDREVQDMHKILRDAFSEAVINYSGMKPHIASVTSVEGKNAINTTKIALASTAQALLEADRELRARAEEKRSFQRKL